MRTVVVFPGRFQPAHRGHLAVYNRLQNEFDDVFIATSDKTAPNSPFTFSDKVEMWAALGVPASRVVNVRSPYNPIEITREIPDPDHTALVMAVSEKDMQGENARFRFGVKKDGSPSYLQQYPGSPDDLDPVTEHAYIYTIPTTEFKLGSVSADSATQIRQAFAAANDSGRRSIIHDLYGDVNQNLVRTFERRLQLAESIRRSVRSVRHSSLSESKLSRVKLIIESVIRAEHSVDGQAFHEDLRQDYRRER